MTWLLQSISWPGRGYFYTASQKHPQKKSKNNNREKEMYRSMSLGMLGIFPHQLCRHCLCFSTEGLITNIRNPVKEAEHPGRVKSISDEPPQP